MGYSVSVAMWGSGGNVGSFVGVGCTVGVGVAITVGIGVAEAALVVKLASLPYDIPALF